MIILIMLIGQCLYSINQINVLIYFCLAKERIKHVALVCSSEYCKNHERIMTNRMKKQESAKLAKEKAKLEKRKYETCKRKT